MLSWLGRSSSSATDACVSSFCASAGFSVCDSPRCEACDEVTIDGLSLELASVKGVFPHSAHCSAREHVFCGYKDLIVVRKDVCGKQSQCHIRRAHVELFAYNEVKLAACILQDTLILGDWRLFSLLYCGFYVCQEPLVCRERCIRA